MAHDRFESEATIELKDGQVTVDAGAKIKQLLEDNWEDLHTDGRVPKVIYHESYREIRTGGQDWIVVQNMPETGSYTTLKDFRSEVIPISLQLYTSEGRKHIFLMKEEVERILHGSRHDTFGSPGNDGGITGRVYLEITRRIPIDFGMKGVWRYVMDVDVHWRMRQVKT